MKISDILKETYSSLSANKARSGLTMLGIVIGISSVIVMVSIGQGTQSSITSSIESMGSNLITVSAGAQRNTGSKVNLARGTSKTLTQADADAIAEQITSVEAVAPELSGNYQITSKGSNTNTSVDGTNSSYLSVKNLEIDEGVFITEQNLKSISKVAVIGPTVRDDLFGENATNVIGQTIKINKLQFKVVGITKSKGGSGFGSTDEMIFIPLTTAQRFLAGDNYVSTINVQATDESVMTQTQEEISTLLLQRHNITDSASADFTIMNQADILETASSITGTLTLLLAAIAGISLLVGGIGIMNMMLTTVTERTKEIGLRKAIGAKRHDINIQFLIEATMLTFVGGGIGILLGWGISFGISYLGLIQTSISMSSIILAFCVSAGIGIIFGYYPARNASALNPIDALRYE
ncbi:MAG: ABC transporter permease [Candidatus Gracilibacteria bacterium]|jgi:putative ABC transport system permease protein